MIKKDEKLKVGILGATGMVGQRFITLLKDHPWFEVELVAASPNSAGKTYEEAVRGRWKMEQSIPSNVKDMKVYDVSNVNEIASKVDFVFSAVAMSKEKILEIEEKFAKLETPVISNNSAYRSFADVPMLIPEVNFDHARIVNSQLKRLGTKNGFISVKPNCSVQCYVPLLKAWEKFEPSELVVSTYQAISGAGKDFNECPEILNNIIPYIKGEEEKSEIEPLKILGTLATDAIIPNNSIKITCQCIRVPVLYGHTASVYINFRKKPTKEELIDALNNYPNLPKIMMLPSATNNFIRYIEDDDRPQVSKDVWYEKGMGITVGRLREDSIFDFKFVSLSHNTIRGAAGGGILSAELFTKLGYITKKEDLQ